MLCWLEALVALQTALRCRTNWTSGLDDRPPVPLPVSPWAAPALVGGGVDDWLFTAGDCFSNCVGAGFLLRFHRLDTPPVPVSRGVGPTLPPSS